MTPIDRQWLTAHPLPVHEPGTDKNSRGRVLLVGGGHFVPGALRLTGEAVLRAGAGKLQMATAEAVAIALGVLIPEAAMIALPVDDAGEIDAAAIPLLTQAVAACHTLILGPGMSGNAETLVAALVGGTRPDLTVVLDAAALAGCGALEDRIRAHKGRVILTPHFGEMAQLTGMSVDDIADHQHDVATDVAERFDATVVLKGERTVVASRFLPAALDYAGGGVGLATGGSGDVLAGIIGALAARSASPEVAAAWGVWLHGEAGKVLQGKSGPIGFLARELAAEVPRLMAPTGLLS